MPKFLQKTILCFVSVLFCYKGMQMLLSVGIFRLFVFSFLIMLLLSSKTTVTFLKRNGGKEARQKGPRSTTGGENEPGNKSTKTAMVSIMSEIEQEAKNEDLLPDDIDDIPEFED